MRGSASWPAHDARPSGPGLEVVLADHCRVLAPVRARRRAAGGHRRSRLQASAEECRALGRPVRAGRAGPARGRGPGRARRPPRPVHGHRAASRPTSCSPAWSRSSRCRPGSRPSSTACSAASAREAVDEVEIDAEAELPEPWWATGSTSARSWPRSCRWRWIPTRARPEPTGTWPRSMRPSAGGGARGSPHSRALGRDCGAIWPGARDDPDHRAGRHGRRRGARHRRRRAPRWRSSSIPTCASCCSATRRGSSRCWPGTAAARRRRRCATRRTRSPATPSPRWPCARAATPACGWRSTR